MIQGTRLHPFNMARKGKCRICRTYGPLDPHHIISQGHAKRTGQLDLIRNKGNIVWICRNCHDQTTASKSYRKMNEEYKKKGKKTAKAAPKPRRKAKRTRCIATTKGETSIHIGHRCRIKALPGEDYCHVHRSR